MQANHIFIEMHGGKETENFPLFKIIWVLYVQIMVHEILIKNPFLLLIAISSWKPGQSDWSF